MGHTLQAHFRKLLSVNTVCRHISKFKLKFQSQSKNPFVTNTQKCHQLASLGPSSLRRTDARLLEVSRGLMSQHLQMYFGNQERCVLPAIG